MADLLVSRAGDPGRRWRLDTDGRLHQPLDRAAMARLAAEGQLWLWERDAVGILTVDDRQAAFWIGPELRLALEGALGLPLPWAPFQPLPLAGDAREIGVIVAERTLIREFRRRLGEEYRLTYRGGGEAAMDLKSWALRGALLVGADNRASCRDFLAQAALAAGLAGDDSPPREIQDLLHPSDQERFQRWWLECS
ncbi:MAG: hypothetical protein HQL82_04260 [Magnetococcales bacterium]|nr:hypothetical protein [Magnetococcales bacterium]